MTGLVIQRAVSPELGVGVPPPPFASVILSKNHSQEKKESRMDPQPPLSCKSTVSTQQTQTKAPDVSLDVSLGLSRYSCPP